jgi:hypothetical protein
MNMKSEWRYWQGLIRMSHLSVPTCNKISLDILLEVSFIAICPRGYFERIRREEQPKAAY